MNPRQSSPSGLTEASLERLLSALDGNRETAGQKYETLRRGVVRFFEWRGCRSSDEWADEVIDRAARKLEEGAEISEIYPYVLGVARFVLKEFWRDQERQKIALREFQPPPILDKSSERDRCLGCIEKCLASLATDERELVLAYYRDDKRQKIENRRDLADRLGIPVAALRMRVHRLRARLEVCVGDCTQS